MGAGVLGWIAATPVIAVGLWIAQWIAKKTHADMTHPIIEPLTTPGAFQAVAVLLAVVWAPLAEESMFRGLLFPGLSASLRWVMGALIGAFVFAVIHPQGWAAVPAIMAIALGASMLKLVRGSLIAPMTLHALNNGTLVAMLILCAG
jgi:membrane protease YdiL (CAAX protease family)